MSTNKNQNNQSESNHSNVDEVGVLPATDETLQDFMEIVENEEPQNIIEQGVNQNTEVTANPNPFPIVDLPVRNSRVGLMHPGDVARLSLPVVDSETGSPVRRSLTPRFTIPPSPAELNVEDLVTQVGALDAGQLKAVEEELLRRKELLREFQQQGWPTTSVNRKFRSTAKARPMEQRMEQVDVRDSRVGMAKPKINYKAPKPYDGSNRYKAEEFLSHCRHYL